MKRLCAFTVLCTMWLWAPAPARGGTLPANFQEAAIFTGLNLPTAVKFSPDGRVFVAEKRGVIKVFPNLSTNTPTVFVDIRTKVYNFWDRGLLGIALHPNFPTTPYVYVLYTLDRKPGGTIPSWGQPNTDSDPCPTPPGPTTDGCTVTARLSRFKVLNNVADPNFGDSGENGEDILIEEWCQQFPSHSIGSLVFGNDGALYVTGGDGASFVSVDYGQYGGTTNPIVTPVNPCGDPPGGVGGSMTPPMAEGGALRSQSRQRVLNGPVVLDGAVLRLDPETGAAHPTNPLINSSDVNERRVIADGLRNPFRAAWRPGTGELWLGDVGWSTWEEINRVPNPTSEVRNFGWPCYEGVGRQPGYEAAALHLCDNLYAAAGAVTPPLFTYNHSSKVVPGEACVTGSSAIAGLAFHPVTGPYPASYRGGLFFTDYNRRCIWVMLPDGSGTPDPSQVQTFDANLSGGAVALETGPNGDLFYVDFDGGRIVRISYFSGNNPPTASFTATPQNGPAPLTVLFDASGSSDPEGQALSYAWDLDGDSAFDDATGVTTSFQYVNPGNYTVSLRVTDTGGATATTSKVISSNNTPPTATILTPSSSLTWKVGDVINFSGSATDQQQGTLPASGLAWTLILHHCPSNCHEHIVQEFAGVASGSVTAPDHEYPSYLELRLVATDAGGLTDTKSVSMLPQTVVLTFESSPSGLQLALNGTSAAAPFSSTVIIGSQNSVSAPSPQTLAGTSYVFSSWSDGGAQSHTVTAPASATTYRATYTADTTVQPSVSVADVSVNEGNPGTSSSAVFTVSLSAPGAQTITVSWSTVSGGAAKAGSDYVSSSGTVTILPGATSGTFSVPVIPDTVKEKNEAFSVRLQSATNAIISIARATGQILNDD